MATLTSPTAQMLLTDVRTQLNQRDPTNSFWTDTELVGYLNDAVAIYFLEAAQADEGYFTTPQDIDIVSGQESYTLPADCFQVKILYKKVTNGYVPCMYNQGVDNAYSTQGDSGPSFYIPIYKFRGNSLILQPTPQFAETGGLKLEYIQFPDQMVYGGDSLTSQVSPIFRQLITMYAVYRAKLRESMAQGLALHKTAEEHLAMLLPLYRDSLPKRSKGQTYVKAFNPETEY